ncbi:hypothetical protein LX36DRAFT_210122 [Colletotrichum falcatum]|nr:hypothetical protein LX36DRAFT_210122 [Colletotrichum falcatum]
MTSLEPFTTVRHIASVLTPWRVSWPSQCHWPGEEGPQTWRFTDAMSNVSQWLQGTSDHEQTPRCGLDAWPWHLRGGPASRQQRAEGGKLVRTPKQKHKAQTVAVELGNSSRRPFFFLFFFLLGKQEEMTVVRRRLDSRPKRVPWRLEQRPCVLTPAPKGAIRYWASSSANQTVGLGLLSPLTSLYSVLEACRRVLGRARGLLHFHAHLVFSRRSCPSAANLPQASRRIPSLPSSR